MESQTLALWMRGQPDYLLGYRGSQSMVAGCRWDLLNTLISSYSFGLAVYTR